MYEVALKHSSFSEFSAIKESDVLIQQNRELFLMDTYYRELIAKERAAFERILESRLNV